MHYKRGLFMLYNCCSGKIWLNMKEVSESHVIVARLHVKCRESKYLIGIFGSVKCSSSNRDNKLVNRDQSGRKRKRTQRRTFSSVLDKACDENTRPSVLLHMEGSFRSYNEVNCLARLDYLLLESCIYNSFPFRS